MEVTRAERKVKPSTDGQLQAAGTLVMVPPNGLAFDEATAASNHFQRRPEEIGLKMEEVGPHVQREFSAMVEKLRSLGVEIIVLDAGDDAVTRPNAVFPNNWFTHHTTPDGAGALILYPLLSASRRTERRPELLLTALKDAGHRRPQILDLSRLEDDGEILEGTGSLVLDRVKRLAFAALSARTTRHALDAWCHLTGYTPVVFHASDREGFPIYHTNVVMSVATAFAVVCFEAIRDEGERSQIRSLLESAGKELIEIDLEQVYRFCGNLIEVRTDAAGSQIVMSKNAANAMTSVQISRLERYGEICPVEISTIEAIGGGSAKCMVAEIYPTPVLEA